MTQMTGQQFYQDVTVYDTGGEKIGTVQAYDPQGGYITVQKGTFFHKDLYIPVNAVQSTDAEGNVYLSLHKDDLADDRYDNPPTSGAASDDRDAQTATVTETATTRAQTTPRPSGRQTGAAAQTGDTIDVPVYEEELVVGTRQEQIGNVRVHKDVVQEQESVPVTLRHEEVTVERVPVTGQARQTDLTDAFRGQDIEVPVMGEEAVVGKQVRETEEVRLHKDVTQEREQVSDMVRKERVVVEGVDTTGTTGGHPTPRTKGPKKTKGR